MSTPTLNPPSLRFPFELVGHPREIVEAHRFAFNGLLDLNQAVRALNTKVNTNTTSIAAAATTVNTVTQIISNALPGLGTVNDQTGQTSYITVPGDNGAFLILSDASPVAVTLTIPSSGQPWMMFTMNWGAGLVTFTPSSPASISSIGNLLASSLTLANGYFASLFWDGFNFFAETLPVAAVNLHSWNIQTTTYTAVAADDIIAGNSASPFTITLPVVGVTTGQTYFIKNLNTGTLTVAPSSGNIDSHASIALSQWQSIQVSWSGSQWVTIGQGLSV